MKYWCELTLHILSVDWQSSYLTVVILVFSVWRNALWLGNNRCSGTCVFLCVSESVLCSSSTTDSWTVLYFIPDDVLKLSLTVKKGHPMCTKILLFLSPSIKRLLWKIGHWNAGFSFQFKLQTNLIYRMNKNVAVFGSLDINWIFSVKT